MNFTQRDIIEIMEDAVSWIVVMAMFVYGAGKLFQFEGSTEIDKSVMELTGMELMWAFYGFSKPYAITLGIFELIGGMLILIKKTRILGCLFASTILVNVVFQDIYYGVHAGALKAAIFYQLILLFVLWLNRVKLIESLRSLIKLDSTKQPKMKFFVKLLIAIGCFVGLRILEYFLTINH